MTCASFLRLNLLKKSSIAIVMLESMDLDQVPFPHVFKTDGRPSFLYEVSTTPPSCGFTNRYAAICTVHNL